MIGTLYSLQSALRYSFEPTTLKYVIDIIPI